MMGEPGETTEGTTEKAARTATKKKKTIAAPAVASARMARIARLAELEVILEAAQDGVAVYDLEGRVVRSNAAYRASLDYLISKPPAAILRERVKQAPLLDARGEALAEDQWPHTRILRGEVIGGDDAVEVVMYTTDGEALHLSVTGAPLRADDGRIVGALVMHRDVTAQRHLEQERVHLLEQERAARAEAEIAAAQLRAVLRVLPVSVVVSEVDGHLAQMNAAFRALWGVTAPRSHSIAEYRAYKGWWPKTGKLVQPEEWAGARALLTGETVGGEEIEIETFDGQRKTILNHAAPIYDTLGAIRGAVSAAVDITERKRRERQLSDQADELKAIFDAVTDPVLVYDAEGTLLRANPAAYSTLPMQVLTTARVSQTTKHSDDTSARDAASHSAHRELWPISRLLRGETLTLDHAVELRLDLLGGRQALISVTGAPIFASDGSMRGAVVLARDVTEQRRLQRETAAWAGQLNATFDALTDGLLIYDATGGLTRMNDAARAILALDAAPVDDAHSPADRATRLQVRDAHDRPLPPEEWGLAMLARGERLVDPAEIRITALDGRVKDLSITGGPVRGARGEPIGAVALLRDVTERRLLERETRRQASMLERAHDAIFLGEWDGPIVSWNRGAELLYGYTKDEAIGQLSHQLLQTERPVSPGLFRAALQRNGEWMGEITHTTRDGRRTVVESRHQLLVEPDGRRYVLQTCRDLTERLRLEKEVRQREATLRESEERLQLALDASASGAFVWYPEEDRTEPDRRMLSLFGLPSDSPLTLAQALATLIHEEDRARYASAVAQATDPWGNGALHEDIRVILPDGSLRWLAIAGQVAFDDDLPSGTRKPVRMAGTAMDITERKHTEAALRLNDERQSFLLALADALRPLADPATIEATAIRVLGEHLQGGRTLYAEVLDDGATAVIAADYCRGAMPSIVGRHRIADFGASVFATLHAGRISLIEDCATSPELTPHERAAYAAIGTNAHVTIPLVKDGHFTAFLSVNHDTARAWTREEIALIGETAERTWAAVERARAEAEVRRARDELERRVRERTRELATANRTLRQLSQRILEVQESERRFIAQELHDEIGQALTGAKMMLEMLEADPSTQVRERQNTDQNNDQNQGLDAPAPRIQEDVTGAARGAEDAEDADGRTTHGNTPRLAEVREAIAETLAHVRDLSLDLRPAILDSLGVAAALSWMMERYTRQTGVRVAFSHQGLDHRMSPHLEAGIYRLTQEALTNVARHAGVDVVTVQLLATTERLSLFVVDEGTGFDADEALTASLSTGLAGMRERASLLGGTLTITSLPGEGTTIEAEFPFLPASGSAQGAGQEGGPKDTQAEVRDTSRDKRRDEQRDLSRDPWRDSARDAKRDTVRDALRDVSRDTIHDRRRDREEPTP